MQALSVETRAGADPARAYSAYSSGSHSLGSTVRRAQASVVRGGRNTTRSCLAWPVRKTSHARIGSPERIPRTGWVDVMSVVLRHLSERNVGQSPKRLRVS